MAHTPGEWKIDLETPFTLGGDCRSVYALNSDGLVERDICSLMFDTDEWPDGEGWLEDIANAKLIADAPKLLAWKEQAIPLLMQWDDIGESVGGGLGSSKVENVRNELARLRSVNAKLLAACEAFMAVVENNDRMPFDDLYALQKAIAEAKRTVSK